MAPWTYLACLPVLHVSTLFLLSGLRARQQSNASKGQHQVNPASVTVLVVRCTGIVVATLTLLAPYYVDLEHGLVQAGLRTACFFYAFKLLDLAVARAHEPPTLFRDQARNDEHPTTRSPAPMETLVDRLRYASRLLTEMRYHSFSIAVHQPHRPHSSPRTWIPTLVLPIFTYLFPRPEAKCALLLLTIQHFFEILHSVLHPRCPHPVFYRPFSATSLSEFWVTHWQACASPWLRNVAYKPVQNFLTPVIGREASRAMAVLAVFSVTGVWHGWAAAAAVEDAWTWTLGLQVWAWFLSMGVGCLVERWVWGAKQQGGWVRWAIVWAYALYGAGLCARTLECHEKMGWLSKHGC